MEEIIEALRKWNPWWSKPEINEKLIGIPRERKAQLMRLASLRQIKDIIGIRRSGKTTLMYQIIAELLKTVPSNRIIFVKCDDLVLNTASFNDIEKAFYRVSPQPEYIFLDEIQEKPNWEKWVKNIYDIHAFGQIFLTGSNASLLSKDLGTLLTGRHISVHLLPFSFKEYLQAEKWEDFSFGNLRQERQKIIYYLNNYLKNGGFPETFNNEDTAKIMLTEIYNDIVSRDIALRHTIEISKLNNLIYYLITNSSKEFSYRSIARVTGLNIETAERYIAFVTSACLIFTVGVFSYALKTQFKQNKKIYCIDTGLVNAIGFKFSSDIGRMYENAAAIELKRRNKEFYYWKDKSGKEVDFIVKEGLKITDCLQVCYELNAEAKQREIKNLLAACQEFKLKKGIIITEDEDKEEKINGILIKYISLWEWLLREE